MYKPITLTALAAATALWLAGCSAKQEMPAPAAAPPAAEAPAAEPPAAAPATTPPTGAQGDGNKL